MKVIHCPTDEEIDRLDVFEITSPQPYEFSDPQTENDLLLNRQDKKRKYKDYPGGLSLDKWRKRLALATEDVIRKTFKATTQLTMSLEVENRAIPRQHYKSRFPYLRESRVNDVFHSDTFFPSIPSNTGDTCSQLFLGKETDYMKVYPMRKESHSFQALQDFVRNIGVPKGLKTDNAATEVGHKWTNFCRETRIDTKFTEPHSPWLNYSEHGIGALGRMVS